MHRQISITLPVASLPKSVAFFQALGFSLHPHITGDTAAGVMLSETVLVMLLPQSKFAEFSPQPVCDTSLAAEVLLGIGCASRAEVDDLIARAGEAGGTIHERSVDYGFMYHASFADPDGHLWSLNYLSDPPPQS